VFRVINTENLNQHWLDDISKDIREAEVAPVISDRRLLGSKITKFFETRNPKPKPAAA
jgi:hypothetical protein